jgi:HPt (histidine-containing phosphotransfer) domain-containing protein
MKEYKKASLTSLHLRVIGVMVLLALLSSSGPYAPSFGVQYQQLQQQLPTIIAASDIQNMTTEATGLNGTTNVANETTTTTTLATAPDVILVEFVSGIEQIRGHLDQALINKESGNNTLAQAHSLHPIEEVYSTIEDQLVNQNSTLNQTLSAALQNLSSTVTNATPQDFKSQIDYVDGLLNNSVQTLVPSSELNNNPAFNASVVGHLLELAGHEYQEAVANGTIIEAVEFQDAQAFIHRAENVFKSSTSRINQSLAHEVEEVNQFFSNLNSTVNNRDDPQTIETTINGIMHKLAGITGLSESQLIGEETSTEGQDSIAIIDNIKSLLTRLTQAYESQDYQRAESIATEAYLDNYEYIEVPLAQRDKQLMEQTEVMLREELRQMITDRVPIDQIEQHITMINANLDRAAELLQ